MIENVCSYTQTNVKTIERLIEDDHIAINHMVLGQGEKLPDHDANSHVTMIVIRGKVTLTLDEQEAHAYPAGSLISIPYKTRMRVSNQDEPVLELFVVKAPSPKTLM